MGTYFFLIFALVVAIALVDYLDDWLKTLFMPRNQESQRMNLLSEALDSKNKAAPQVTEELDIYAVIRQAELEEALEAQAEANAIAEKRKATAKAAVEPQPADPVIVTHTVCQDATTLLESPVTHWVDMEQRTAKRFGAWITTDDGSVFRAFRDAAGNVIVPDYVKAVVEPAELTATSEAVYVEKTMEPWEIEEELIKQCASSPQADLFAPSGIFPNNTVH